MKIITEIIEICGLIKMFLTLKLQLFDNFFGRSELVKFLSCSNSYNF